MLIEHELIQYTDLNRPQLDDLKRIASGEKTMNGARRYAMAELIDENHKLTPWGSKVLARAIRLESEYNKPLTRDSILKVTANVAATWARKHLPDQRKLYSVHVKVLNELYERPDQCYKHLTGIYGYDAVSYLLLAGVISGRAVMGGQFALTTYGMALMETFGKLGSDENEQPGII